MKIISRWSSDEKDEHKKILSRTHHIVMELSPGRRVYQVESFEDFTGGVDQQTKQAEASEPKLNFDGPASTMTKGEFRDSIRRKMFELYSDGKGIIDHEKLDLAILKTNRQSRRNFGGLVYTLETINIALEIYKTL